MYLLFSKKPNPPKASLLFSSLVQTIPQASKTISTGKEGCQKPALKILHSSFFSFSFETIFGYNSCLKKQVHQSGSAELNESGEKRAQNVPFITMDKVRPSAYNGQSKIYHISNRALAYK